MDTEYWREALKDGKLYHDIVEHRRKFYHVGYADYDRDYPERIDIVPRGEMLEAFRRDCNDNMLALADELLKDKSLSRIQIVFDVDPQ